MILAILAAAAFQTATGTVIATCSTTGIHCVSAPQTITPAEAAQRAHDRNPEAFCEGVWTSLILSKPNEAGQADTAEISYAGSWLPFVGSNSTPAVTISCPRPSWYKREPKVISPTPSSMTSWPSSVQWATIPINSNTVVKP